MSNVDNESDMQPHSKQNMPTRIGRLVDRAAYIDLLLLAVGVIAVSTLYFTLISVQDGLGKSDIRPLDALYFSIVTFTTLGYGDYSPMGFGRGVSVFVVTCGLALTALLIGKIASERQLALLTLLHTSDSQRRISGFTSEMQDIRGIIEQKDRLDTKKNIQELRGLIVSINKYLAFNAFQARIVDFGNYSTLSSLYEELETIFSILMRYVFESSNDANSVIMTRSMSVAIVINNTIRLMNRFYQSNKPRSSIIETLVGKELFSSPRNRSNTETAAKAQIAKISASMTTAMGRANEWRRTGYHPIQLDTIQSHIKEKGYNQWIPGLHKVIVTDLELSNTVVSRSINRLVELQRIHL